MASSCSIRATSHCNGSRPTVGLPRPSCSSTRVDRKRITERLISFPTASHLVYYSAGKKGVNIMLASLDGKLNRVAHRACGRRIICAQSSGGGGWILYNVRGQLLARPFDLDKLEFTGQPAVIADGVWPARWWYPSTNGLLAFRHNYGTQLSTCLVRPRRPDVRQLWGFRSALRAAHLAGSEDHCVRAHQRPEPRHLDVRSRPQHLRAIHVRTG